MDREEITLNKDHQATFKAIVENKAGNFHLFPMYVNGELSSCIVSVNKIKDSEDVIAFPFFVAITPGMVLRDPETDIEITGEQICSISSFVSDSLPGQDDEPPKIVLPNSTTREKGNGSSKN